MAKRGPSSDLHQDNWDKEDEREEAGLFATASTEQMRNRVLKKGKRRCSPSDNEENSGIEKPKNAFSGFSGFGVKPSGSNAVANPESGLSASIKFCNTTTTNNSTPAVTSVATNGSASFFSFKKANFKSTVAIPTNVAKEEVTTSEPIVAAVNRIQQSPMARSRSTSPQKATVAPQQRQGCANDFLSRLQQLNESVVEWITKHVSDNPHCVLSPVFKDYNLYFTELETKYPNMVSFGQSVTLQNLPTKQDQTRKSLVASTLNKSGLPTTTLTTTATTTAATITATPAPTGGLKRIKNEESKLVHGKSESLQSHSPTAGKSSSWLRPVISVANTLANTFAPISASSFSSNIRTDPVAKTVGIGGNTKDENAVLPVPFGVDVPYGVSLPSSSGPSTRESTVALPMVTSVTSMFSFACARKDESAQNNNNDEGDDEADNPPKVEVQTVVEEGSFYSQRCKLFYKRGDEFIDRGIGMLHLKPAGDKTQLVIRADTNLGNILLNIILSASIPVQRTGKNNVTLCCIPNPPIETQPKGNSSSSSSSVDTPANETAITMLIRVKSVEEADELFDRINKHKS